MVLQTGAPGGVTALFVRGGESNYNTVLLDGIPLNEPGGTFNFNNLTTENIERIEIVRGANSALFGSDAMSSVVQLFTNRGAAARRRRHRRVSAQIDGGSYGTLHATAAASGVARQIRLLGGGGPLLRPTTACRTARSTTRRVSANVGTALGANAMLRVIVRGELGKTGTPGQTAYGRPDLDAFYEHHDVVGGITFDQQVNRAFHQRATYSLTVVEAGLDQPDRGSAVYAVVRRARVALRVVRLHVRQPHDAAPSLRELPGGLARRPMPVARATTASRRWPTGTASARSSTTA